MKAVRRKAVRGTIAMALLAVLGFVSVGASFGCNTYYDPYWDIQSVAWNRQFATDLSAYGWDDEILNY